MEQQREFMANKEQELKQAAMQRPAQPNVGRDD